MKTTAVNTPTNEKLNGSAINKAKTENGKGQAKINGLPISREFEKAKGEEQKKNGSTCNPSAHRRTKGGSPQSGKPTAKSRTGNARCHQYRDRCIKDWIYQNRNKGTAKTGKTRS